MASLCVGKGFQLASRQAALLSFQVNVVLILICVALTVVTVAPSGRVNDLSDL